MSNSFEDIVERYPGWRVEDYLRRYLSYHWDEIDIAEYFEWLELIERFLKQRVLQEKNNKSIIYKRAKYLKSCLEGKNEEVVDQIIEKCK